MWLFQAAWEEQEELLRQKMAPREERRMRSQEESRMREIGIAPPKRISPEEYLSRPEVLHRYISDTLKRINDYPLLIQSLLMLPEDVLLTLAEKNFIDATQWEEIEANLAATLDVIDQFNQGVQA